MRTRSGLMMGSFEFGEVIVVSRLELEVAAPSILKTERLPRYPMYLNWLGG